MREALDGTTREIRELMAELDEQVTAAETGDHVHWGDVGDLSYKLRALREAVHPET
jgi:hypothetical protein